MLEKVHLLLQNSKNLTKNSVFLFYFLNDYNCVLILQN